MKRTPLTAMLTLVVALASSFAAAGCGGKAGELLHRETVDKRYPHDDHARAQAQVQTGLLARPFTRAADTSVRHRSYLALIPSFPACGSEAA